MSFALKTEDLETDSASPEAAQVIPASASSRKMKSVKHTPARTTTISCDEYDLMQATIRRQEGTIVNLRQVFESEMNNKECELQITKKKAERMEQALNGMEKQLQHVVRLHMAQLGKGKGEHGSTPVQVSQTGERLQYGSPSQEQDPCVVKCDSDVTKADLRPSDSEVTTAACHVGTPCDAFKKVAQENLRLKKFCKELESRNGISLTNHEYEEVITKLRQEVMQVKLELQNTRTALTLKENGQKDALAHKLVELQQENAKLLKNVVTKATLLSMYNREYEKLKQSFLQLQLQLKQSEKDQVKRDTGTLVERQRGDGMEMVLNTTKSEARDELVKLQAKHAQDMERLTREREDLQEEIIRLQCLNKEYAASIEELSKTRRSMDEQPISMGDLRKELDRLREERLTYAEDIKRYTQRMDEMELEIRTRNADILSQKQIFTQQQEQYERLFEENTKLQRQLDEVNKHNKQLKYQHSRSPQTSTDSQGSFDEYNRQQHVLCSQSSRTSTGSQGSLSRLSSLPVGPGIVVADGPEEEEELRCSRCDRLFTNPDKLKVHERKCLDS